MEILWHNRVQPFSVVSAMEGKQKSSTLSYSLLSFQISSAIEAILTADSASRKQEVQAWDGEVRRVSRHAFSLQQLQNAVRIPPW